MLTRIHHYGLLQSSFTAPPKITASSIHSTPFPSPLTIHHLIISTALLFPECHVIGFIFAVIQSLSHVQVFATPWTAAHQASLSFTISWSLLKLVSVESVMPADHLILCHPLLLLPSTFPSIRVCSIESVLDIRWSKHWRFSFSISPSNEYSGLMSFRMDWLDLLAVQGTLKSLLQYPYLKASIHIFPSLSG